MAAAGSWNNKDKRVSKNENFIAHHKTTCLSLMFQLSAAAIKLLRDLEIISKLTGLNFNDV